MLLACERATGNAKANDLRTYRVYHVYIPLPSSDEKSMTSLECTNREIAAFFSNGFHDICCQARVQVLHSSKLGDVSSRTLALQVQATHRSCNRAYSPSTQEHPAQPSHIWRVQPWVEVQVRMIQPAARVLVFGYQLLQQQCCIPCTIYKPFF